MISRRVVPWLNLSGWGLAVGLDSSGEYGVADGDGGIEDVQGRNPGTGNYHRLIPWKKQHVNSLHCTNSSSSFSYEWGNEGSFTRNNEEGEENREDASGHDLALRHARYHRQGKSKAQKIRPVYLNKVQAFVKLNS